jgi:hypothetical protein
MIGPRSAYYEKLKEFETELIREALTKSKGNQAQAARRLGIAPTTLASQLRRLGIQTQDFKQRESANIPETFQRFLLQKSITPEANNETR